VYVHVHICTHFPLLLMNGIPDCTGSHHLGNSLLHFGFQLARDSFTRTFARDSFTRTFVYCVYVYTGSTHALDHLRDPLLHFRLKFTRHAVLQQLHARAEVCVEHKCRKSLR
jgi:hypothetical protein